MTPASPDHCRPWRARAQTWLQVAGANADIEIVALCDPEPGGPEPAQPNSSPTSQSVRTSLMIIGTDADAVLTMHAARRARAPDRRVSCAQGSCDPCGKALGRRGRRRCALRRDGRGRQVSI